MPSNYKIKKLNAYTVDIQIAGTTFRDKKIWNKFTRL